MPMAKRMDSSPVVAKYEFIKANVHDYEIQTMCRVLEVARSGYYSWLKEPVSRRAQENARLLRLCRATYFARLS